MHCTCAALPVVTALFGTRQVEMFAQRVEQRRTRVQVEVPHTTVDGQRDLRVLRIDLGLIDNGGYAHSQLTFFSGPSRHQQHLRIVCSVKGRWRKPCADGSMSGKYL